MKSTYSDADLRTLVKERIATFCPGHLVLKTLNIVIGKSPPGGERIVKEKHTLRECIDYSGHLSHIHRS